MNPRRVVPAVGGLFPILFASLLTLADACQSENEPANNGTGGSTGGRSGSGGSATGGASGSGAGGKAGSGGADAGGATGSGGASQGGSGSGGAGRGGASGRGGAGGAGAGGATGTGTGGASGAGGGGSPYANFASVKEVAMVLCGGSDCHNPKDNPPTLLDEAKLYSTLMTFVAEKCGNRVLVKPGAPSESAFYLAQMGQCGDSLVQMPKGCVDNCTPPDYLDGIRQWIESGAPEN